MSSLERWKNYNQAGSTQPPRPRLVNTLDRFWTDAPGLALDLGAGGGRDTKELLKRGWTVEAMDSDPHSMEILKQLAREFPKLRLIHSAFEGLSLPAKRFELINASYSLPFCESQKFLSFWNQITSSLKIGGLFTFELFGDRDSWRLGPQGTDGSMYFLSREQLENLISPLEILFLKEEESDSKSFSGEMKHWHLFVCVLRKRSATPLPE